MYNSRFSKEPSSNNLSGIRIQSTFLVKPCFEGRSYPCYQSGFEATTSESVRVTRLEDMRLGIEEHTDEEFYDLKGKQPVFYFMETLAPKSPYQWNGRLLFSHVNKEVTRKLIEQHQQEWNIVLAFSDPDADRYFFVVDTHSEETTEEAFLKARKEWATRLNQTLAHVTQHNMNFYVRALTPDYYDIINSDALFGKPEPVQQQEDFRSCRPMSVGEIIQTFFGRIFKF